MGQRESAILARSFLCHGFLAQPSLAPVRKSPPNTTLHQYRKKVALTVPSKYGQHQPTEHSLLEQAITRKQNKKIT